jgi:hypothetical protein
MRLGKAAAVAVAVVLSTSACSHDNKDSAATAATTTTTAPLPASKLGDQMQFAIDYANGKVTTSDYAAHFNAGFRASVSNDKLDQIAKVELSPAKPWLFQQFIQGPTATSAVCILRSAGGSKLKMTIGIDGAGLIGTLIFVPYKA